MIKKALCLALFGLLVPVALGESFTPCGNLLPDYDPYAEARGSTYVPMDSWIYPAMDRLHALGQVDIAYIDMKPWTRLSIVHMLQAGSTKMEETSADSDACRIYHSVQRELQPDIDSLQNPARPEAKLASVYTGFAGISGTPLRDSYHLGQSIINDYGRPYEEGFNNIDGFSTRLEDRRFAFYLRGEYQHAPAAAGYSTSLAEQLSAIDQIPFATNPKQDTIPLGPISSVNNVRIVEANLSYLILNNEISFGKNDHWLGPAQGGSFAWSNNADNIYAFEIDRVEPLGIPLLSRLTGPFRYQFFVGPLQGHTDPNAPWVHAEKVSFKPTANLEFGFERTVIWGGKGHVPITIHSFLKSFFSFQDVSAAEKLSRDDPGARFGTFDFSYRLPYLRDWLTLYTDSLVHDDTSPISDTDPPTSRSNGGQFLYWEQIQKQGYTNKGFIMGDWIGRESKGGQAWLTYHLSPREQIQLSYRNAKAAKDFIPGGTTQNVFQISTIKRIHNNFEVKGGIQYEGWKAPIYKPGKQTDVSVGAQITWYP
jgi:Capsule assembly protein Wzi